MNSIPILGLLLFLIFSCSSEKELAKKNRTDINEDKSKEEGFDLSATKTKSFWDSRQSNESTARFRSSDRRIIYENEKETMHEMDTPFTLIFSCKNGEVQVFLNGQSLGTCNNQRNVEFGKFGEGELKIVGISNSPTEVYSIALTEESEGTPIGSPSNIDTLLGEGQGDCDDSSECQEGLTCFNIAENQIESFNSKVQGGETCEVVGESFEPSITVASDNISFEDFIQNTSLATMNKNGHQVNFYRGSGKLPRKENYELSITNVDAQYVLYVESHGRNGHDNKDEDNRDVDIENARLIGIGGGTDKYLALFKVDNDAGHITIKDGSVGAVQIYFIKTSGTLNFQEAWSVDPSVSKNRDPHYKNVPGAGSDSIVLYADDEGGKNESRDATYIRSSFIRYGNGDDRLYVYGGSLDKNNGNGAYMIVNVGN